MKKRNFLMMAAVMLAMSLSACGAQPEPSSEEPKPGESTVEPAPSSSDEQPSDRKSTRLNSSHII